MADNTHCLISSISGRQLLENQIQILGGILVESKFNSLETEVQKLTKVNMRAYSRAATIEKKVSFLRFK